MPKLAVDGVNIYYEVHGEGFPLVLIEGFAGTTHTWTPQIPVLSRDYRLILYDIRGQGQSDAPESPDDYSLEIALDDLHRLLQHLGVQQAVVGGISLGGYLSIHFYHEHPEMVRALILIDAGPGVSNPDRRLQWQKECEERGDIIDRDGMQGFAHSSWSTDDYYTPHAQMLKLNPRGIANVSRRIMSVAWGMEILQEIKVPSLVLCGEHDLALMPATDYMGKKIPDNRKVIVPDACHACNLDNPEFFNRAVLEFMSQVT